MGRRGANNVSAEIWFQATMKREVRLLSESCVSPLTKSPSQNILQSRIKNSGRTGGGGKGEGGGSRTAGLRGMSARSKGAVLFFNETERRISLESPRSGREDLLAKTSSGEKRKPQNFTRDKG